jgi:hypothetical protein
VVCWETCIPRLTGLYAIILGLHATLLKFFGTGIQVVIFITLIGNYLCLVRQRDLSVNLLQRQLVDKPTLCQQP